MIFNLKIMVVLYSLRWFILSCLYFSGIGAVYVINEVEGTIELSYKLHVSSKDYPGRATYKSYLPELAGMQLIKWP